MGLVPKIGLGPLDCWLIALNFSSNLGVFIPSHESIGSTGSDLSFGKSALFR